MNFDVANLILYGKADPAEAVDVLGPYIEGVHAKDGLYPTDPQKLGEEVPIGAGKVKLSEMIAKLKKLGYRQSPDDRTRNRRGKADSERMFLRPRRIWRNYFRN